MQEFQQAFEIFPRFLELDLLRQDRSSLDVIF